MDGLDAALTAVGVRGGAAHPSAVPRYNRGRPSTTHTDTMHNEPPLEAALVPQGTLQGQVYQQLRRQLMMGRFLPGQQLKIRDVAASFGTSMQPVREAIRQLMVEQALETAPNVSARVPRLNAAQLDDLRKMRLVLEGMAAEQAVERIGRKDLARLVAIVGAEDSADEASRVEASVARNLEFHFQLYSHAGSEILPAIIEGLWLRVGPYIRDAAEAFDARGGKGSVHHVELLEALRRKDAAGVRLAVEEDINRFFDLLAAAPPLAAAMAAPKPPARRGRPPGSVNKRPAA